jgi:hypothetical protein
MAARGEPGIIAYAFGVEGRGPGALLNPRTGLVLAATIAVAVVFLFTVVGSNAVGFSVRRSAAASRVLAGGDTAIFFTGIASNPGRSPLTVSLSARQAGGPSLAVRGPVHAISLGGGERKQVDFVLVIPPTSDGEPYPVVFRLAGPNDEPMTETRVTVQPVRPGDPDA